MRRVTVSEGRNIWPFLLLTALIALTPLVLQTLAPTDQPSGITPMAALTATDAPVGKVVFVQGIVTAIDDGRATLHGPANDSVTATMDPAASGPAFELGHFVVLRGRLAARGQLMEAVSTYAREREPR